MKKIKNTIQDIWTSSIRRQLMLGIILVHAVLMTIFVYDLVNRQRDFLHTQSIEQANSLAETLGANSVSWILANDIFGLEEILQSQKRYPDLKYAMVLSPNGRILGHTDDDKIGLYVSDEKSFILLRSEKQHQILVNSINLIDVASPIYSNGQFIGWSRVGLGQEKITSGLNVITRDGILYTILAIIIGALFAFFMARGITKGLKHVVDVADGIKQGNLKLRSNLKRKDELGQLSNDFNIMLDTIAKSKLDLQAILDNSPAVIYAKDLNGRYIFINQKWANLFDKDNKGIIGKTDHEIFSQELADEFVFNDKSVLTAGHALESEEIAPHEDGMHTYFSNKFPLLDDAKEIYAICGISTDITERKKMEDSILSATQHLKLYRDQSPLAAVEWNTDFQVMYWNQAAEKVFGYTFEDVKGKSPIDFLVPDDVVIDVTNVWEALISKIGGRKSINENLCKDGRVILCEWHNTALKDEAGKVIGAASIVLNITEREQKEQLLRRTQKMDALGKLTGGIAHDYNNMLGVVIGYSELLHDMLSDKPQLDKYVEEIHRAGKRGARLTNKLLAFSSQEGGDASIVNINSLLQGQKDMLEKTLTARIKLTLDLSDNLWPIWLDSGDLEDAIVNMCINAMHAMDGNGKLTIQTHNEHIDALNSHALQTKNTEYVILSIIDTGCGMDDATVEKVFDPFYSTKGDKGTGLGLSQVYGFVERSSGVIKVYSEIGHGTRMSLYFPRYYGDKYTNEPVTNKDSHPLEGKENILVVDDEPALIDLITEILSRKGYHVYSAHNSVQALQILENESIDLVLSDVIMPDMDGYQLAAAIQKKYPNIKIQLASGFSDDRHINMTDDNLHKNLLHKPYKSQTLLERLDKLLH